jgi:hypothetical protein
VYKRQDQDAEKEEEPEPNDHHKLVFARHD